MNRIKLLRVTKDLTQLKLQMETGIDKGVISKYETGEYIPTTQNLIILAKYFNTSMDYLMGLTYVEEPYPRYDEK